MDAPALRPVARTLARARAAGVGLVLAVGSDPATNRAAERLAARHPGVGAACGFHPERFDLTEADLDQVEAQVLAGRGRLVALGEVGLPWYGLAERRDRAAVAGAARARLGRLLALARRVDLPVILHAPHGAAAEALALLDRSGAGPAVFHWHKADPTVTRAIVERGHYLGITPEVAYRERDRALVRAAPTERLVLESDGPWPHGGEFGGRPGEPAMVARAAPAVAEVLARPPAEVAAILAANALRCFPALAARAGAPRPGPARGGRARRARGSPGPAA